MKKEVNVKYSAAVASLAALVLLAACNSKPTETTKGKPLNLALWNMSLQVEPETPQMDQEMTFRVKLTDSQGVPVSSGQVSGALVMTTMDMGKNEVPFSETGEGVYEGKGKVEMAGPWELVVTAKVAGLQREKKFPVTIAR